MMGARSGCHTQTKLVAGSTMVRLTSFIDHLSALPFACDLQPEHKCVFLICTFFSCRTMNQAGQCSLQALQNEESHSYYRRACILTGLKIKQFWVCIQWYKAKPMR